MVDNEITKAISVMSALRIIRWKDQTVEGEEELPLGNNELNRTRTRYADFGI
ncbi:hypothetical protein A2U01_0012010 [Trifolium medium]|uniref:Uncharacterized protein n=1 Tax=Trifolium medium TaxID=97028 RepID=A0A392MVP7_9FABA|nr:hypothetical protein [Trifolium medium]